MKKIMTLMVLILASLALISKLSPPITGAVVGSTPVHEKTTASPVVLFCPQDRCLQQFLYLLNNANSTHCAFFDFDLKEIPVALKNKEHKLVVDHRNYDTDLLKELNAHMAQGKSYMHNKFCIFDKSVVWTGSMNPTYRGNFKNHNNVVVLRSPTIAQNYQEEFQELWEETYGKGSKTRHPVVVLNNSTVQSYFCPEDECATQIIREIEKAQQSIYFMTFSFTHPAIAQTLIAKHKQGIMVQGVFETQQRSKWSMFDTLAAADIPVVWDAMPGKIHHKVFIIDNTTVITGSMNPSRNGNTKNDENVLIIEDAVVAQKFLEEYNLVVPT